MKERPKLKEDDYFKYIKTFKIWLKVKKNKKYSFIYKDQKIQTRKKHRKNLRNL